MRVLFKYYSPTHLSVNALSHRRVHFTRPIAFNDPFEMRPYFSGALEPGYITEICQLEDPAETQRWQEQARALMSSPDVLEWAQQRRTGDVVVFSLADCPDNLLMWAHYAKDHTGFVVGFDVEHESFAIRQDRMARHLAEVTYARQRPAAVAPGSLSVEQWFSTKSDDWRYEREWRLFDGVGGLEQTRCGVLVPFAAEAVRQVIVGCRSDAALTDQLRQILATDYPHVVLQQATVDDREYRLNIQAV